VGSDAVVYLASALLGALVGGLVSLGVSSRSARRARRERYGEALLAALLAAQKKLAGATEDAPTTVRDEALEVWLQTELAATLELSRSGRRAMQARAAGLYEALTEGAVSGLDEELEEQLDVVTYLVVAWTAGHARGRDFARPTEELAPLFGPQFQDSEVPVRHRVSRRRTS